MVLNGIQKLVSFFEQIAEMPQNRGCLSWDGVKEGDRREGGWQKHRDEQEDLRLCKKKRLKIDAEERWDAWESGLYKIIIIILGQICRNNIWYLDLQQQWREQSLNLDNQQAQTKIYWKNKSRKQPPHESADEQNTIFTCNISTSFANWSADLMLIVYQPR